MCKYYYWQWVECGHAVLRKKLKRCGRYLRREECGRVEKMRKTPGVCESCRHGTSLCD